MYLISFLAKGTRCSPIDSYVNSLQALVLIQVTCERIVVLVGEGVTEQDLLNPVWENIYKRCINERSLRLVTNYDMIYDLPNSCLFLKRSFPLVFEPLWPFKFTFLICIRM